MAASGNALHSALREWQALLAVWAGVSVLATLAGPFGTMEALAVVPRAFYWAGVVAVAIMLDRALVRLGRAMRQGQALRLGLVVAYAMIMASLVWLLNSYLFEEWGRGAQWLWLVFIILVISGGVHALFRWFQPRADPAAHTKFLARLPVQIRAELIRLEAQDHYLQVVTEKGADLILMRMSDAENELGKAGLRVHRSHWVARSGIREVRRKQGRVTLMMRDGAVVPVSRGYIAALKQAGLMT
ncbi:LytTr DNA-binding domain-containing protein [Roseinatronobacter thiooxidans]|uniref:LytTr DNA-binding domain-containing protein n=1 Tax=Roseinatronobacter thiooxidans TaxID=121821 RepID=A0A2W7QWP3_9RHOB|nr:LytTR family DNA-binding domain-containing protein [Roseinatronobacter thiooxidans]PZX46069.1 LytTr DNA-binding domain-containing protein [Roseinatronobacter thiooxidans]